MIIVSQDKDRIFNFDNLTNILATSAGGDNEWCIKVIFLNLDFEVIGYYRTEERAKEILQEIIEKCQNYKNDMCYIVYKMPEV